MYIYSFITEIFIYIQPGSSVFQNGFNTFIDMAYGPMLWVIASKVKDESFVPGKYWWFFLPAFIACVFYCGIIVYTLFTNTAPLSAIAFYNTATSYLIVSMLLFFSLAAYRISFRLADFWKTERRLIRNISALFLLMSVLIGVTFLLGFFTTMPPGSIIYVRTTFYGLLILVCVAILRYFVVAQTETSLTQSERTVSGQLFQLNERNPDGLHIPEEANVYKEYSTANTRFLQTSVVQTSTIFQEATAVLPAHEVTDAEHTAYVRREKSATAQHQLVMEKLEKLMTANKIYTDPDLDLEALSAQSGISRHQVSETLNKHAAKTFYVFVNEYRIKEVLTMLDKCRQGNIRPNLLSLAFGAGFNSKSSFNLYFKKATGLTPSDYLKSDKKLLGAAVLIAAK